MIGAEETVYVDQMYEVSSASDNPVATINVYLGETRLVSKLANLNDPNATTESRNTFYYHADQLGNSNLITDYSGEEYERMPFTPHGEVWQHSSRDTLNRIDLLFTGKGLDQETGWYYFGARYLDPKTGLWLSGDPAMEEYIPRAPLTDEDKKANGNLPGMGGVYNQVNLATYHYAGNNPVKYVDPDGGFIINNVAPGMMSAKKYQEENRIHFGCNIVTNSGKSTLLMSNQPVTLPNGLDGALRAANKAQQDLRSDTNAEVNVGYKKLESGNYEITLEVTVSIVIDGKVHSSTSSGVIAYASPIELGESFGGIDQAALKSIAQEVITAAVNQ